MPPTKAVHCACVNLVDKGFQRMPFHCHELEFICAASCLNRHVRQAGFFARKHIRCGKSEQRWSFQVNPDSGWWTVSFCSKIRILSSRSVSLRTFDRESQLGPGGRNCWERLHGLTRRDGICRDSSEVRIYSKASYDTSTFGTTLGGPN